MNLVLHVIVGEKKDFRPKPPIIPEYSFPTSQTRFNHDRIFSGSAMGGWVYRLQEMVNEEGEDVIHLIGGMSDALEFGEEDPEERDPLFSLKRLLIGARRRLMDAGIHSIRTGTLAVRQSWLEGLDWGTADSEKQSEAFETLGFQTLLSLSPPDQRKPPVSTFENFPLPPTEEEKVQKWLKELKKAIRGR